VDILVKQKFGLLVEDDDGREVESECFNSRDGGFPARVSPITLPSLPLPLERPGATRVPSASLALTSTSIDECHSFVPMLGPSGRIRQPH